MLTGWFDQNKEDVEANQLYYSQFPNKYVWDAGTRVFSLGRITYVHPAAGELYLLRMLLNHVKGATSFEDLHCISGVVYSTFQLTCKELEVVLIASSSQLRQLFGSVTLLCEIASPSNLLDQFWHSMYDDIKIQLSSLSPYDLHFTDDELKNYVLYELEQLFNALATSLKDYNLPLPNDRLMAGGSNHDQPFDEKSILLSGDFHHILPVIPGGTKEDIINASLSSSLLWLRFAIMLLKQNMRLSFDGLVKLALNLQIIMALVAQHPPFYLHSRILILLILLCRYVWIKPRFDDHGFAYSFAKQVQQVA
uniref:ATP-dependent DNA helicase n=1 Tax=Salix viminalis TaxID=40686 RepID=A0A6N2K087_SALVM